MSVGHDSTGRGVRDTVEGFCARGNAAFFSGHRLLAGARRGRRDGLLEGPGAGDGPVVGTAEERRMAGSGRIAHPPAREGHRRIFAPVTRAGGASPAGAGGYTIHRRALGVRRTDLRYGDVLGAHP
jgi:hypothetical protein